MSQRNVLILERSSQNLKKLDDKGKVVLEGVFAQFGEENRNGRVYEEKEYLPHLEYLKKDMAKGSLLGELDHPERFEVALGNVSHRITELWYDQSNRQIRGRIEVLDTPKGIIAKSLLSAGVPLSISSRAAGTVNEDKTVQIQQIYTYDLVAKPGFEEAELKTVNESAKSRIKSQITKLNEGFSAQEKLDISTELGIINENVSILDLTDKFPSVQFREEALALQNESSDSNVKNKNEENQMKTEVNENALQQWTVHFKNELSKINEKLATLEGVMLEGTAGSSAGELKLIKQYVEKQRKLLENSLNWQGEIATAVNEVASYADTLAEKNNEHFELTQKIVETVDENAKVLNYTQDWVGKNAKVTNAVAETVDHNAKMLNGINEWNTELAKGVNELHEWGTEKAKAINGIHEWTSTIAQNLNQTANWSEDMFGRAMSKDDAKRLVEYIDLVSDSKSDPETKKKLDEALSTHGITGKSLSESMITGIKGMKGLGVITDVKTTGNSKVDTATKKDSGVVIDDKSKAIIAKLRGGKFSKSAKPKELKVLDTAQKETSSPAKGGTKIKGIMVLDTVKGKATPKVKLSRGGAKVSTQNLKLNTKPEGKLNESNSNKDKKGFDAWVKNMEKKYPDFHSHLGEVKGKNKYAKQLDAAMKRFGINGSNSNKDKKGFDAWVKNMEKKYPDFHSHLGEVKGKNKYAKQLDAAMKRFGINESNSNKDKNNLNRTSAIKAKSSTLDEKLGAIITNIEKEKKVDESVKNDFPFTALLNEGDRKSFADLSLEDKKKVSLAVKGNPTTDAGIIKALWENAITISEAAKTSGDPLWLKAAPKEYREIFDASPDTLKESVKARAEFYPLETKYQIENFWQTSGLNPKKERTSLNEVFTAKNSKEGAAKMSQYVAGIGEMMKKYNS